MAETFVFSSFRFGFLRDLPPSEEEVDSDDVDGVGEGGRFEGRDGGRIPGLVGVEEGFLSGDFDFVRLSPFKLTMAPAFLAFISLWI